MLNILGAGFASPNSQVSNQLLAELNPHFLPTDFEAQTGIVQRKTSLELDYLRATKNQDPSQALAHLAQSDLELARLAVEQAVERAGISLSQIGLVIGETSTPLQTIPSQGQRVAGSLSLKVKAYDILAGSASPALHLATINSWQDARIPDYVLLVYSNVPTVFIDYSKVMNATARLSDSAAALVISPRHKGRLSLLTASSQSDVASANQDGFDIAAPLTMNHATEKMIEAQLEPTGQQALKQSARAAKRNFLMPTQISPKAVKHLAATLGFAGDQTLVSEEGDSLSSGALAPLAQQWGNFASGDKIFAVQAGLGLQSGYFVLEVN